METSHYHFSGAARRQWRAFHARRSLSRQLGDYRAGPRHTVSGSSDCRSVSSLASLLTHTPVTSQVGSLDRALCLSVFKSSWLLTTPTQLMRRSSGWFLALASQCRFGIFAVTNMPSNTY